MLDKTGGGKEKIRRERRLFLWEEVEEQKNEIINCNGEVWLTPQLFEPISEV